MKIGKPQQGKAVRTINLLLTRPINFGRTSNFATLSRPVVQNVNDTRNWCSRFSVCHGKKLSKNNTLVMPSFTTPAPLRGQSMYAILPLLVLASHGGALPLVNFPVAVIGLVRGHPNQAFLRCPLVATRIRSSAYPTHFSTTIQPIQAPKYTSPHFARRSPSDWQSSPHKRVEPMPSVTCGWDLPGITPTPASAQLVSTLTTSTIVFAFGTKVSNMNPSATAHSNEPSMGFHVMRHTDPSHPPLAIFTAAFDAVYEKAN